MARFITWIHPSYRDLVIDQLASQRALRLRFLQGMSLQGIKLAVSDTGGLKGERSFPLMVDPEDWGLLSKRCEEIVTGAKQSEIVELLTSLSSAASEAKVSSTTHPLSLTIGVVCEAVRRRWDGSNTIFGAKELLAYSEASIYAKLLPSLPRIDTSWNSKIENLRVVLERSRSGDVLESQAIESWVRFAEAVNANEPRFLRQVGFPYAYKNEIVRLIELLEAEIRLEISELFYDELISGAERFETLASCVDALKTLTPAHRTQLRSLTSKLFTKAKALRDEAYLARSDEDDSDYEDDYDAWRSSRNDFDVDALFADL